MSGFKNPKLFFILFLTLTLVACGRPDKRISQKKVFKLGHNMTMLERPRSSDRFFKKQKFNHPYRIDPVLLKERMESLQYKGLALLSKKKKVFPAPVDKGMIGLISVALDKARPREVVKFTYGKKGGDTKGDLFIVGDKIHWRFDMIRGKEYSRTGHRNWLDSWKLIPGKGQKYHGISGVFGRTPIKNWIVMPIKARAATDEGEAPLIKEEMEAPIEEKAASHTGRTYRKKGKGSSDTSLEKGLVRLKRLRERDLITEEEYRDQKKKLLDKGF